MRYPAGFDPDADTVDIIALGSGYIDITKSGLAIIQAYGNSIAIKYSNHATQQRSVVNDKNASPVGAHSHDTKAWAVHEEQGDADEAHALALVH